MFIAGCHFDERVVPEGDARFFRGGRVAELIGGNIACVADSEFHGARACVFEPDSAVEIDERLYLFEMGAGKVYFLSIADFPVDPRLRRKVENLLVEIAEGIDDDISIEGEDSRFVNYNVWERENGGKTIFMSNVDWFDDRPKSVVLKARGAAPRRITLEKGESLVVRI